MAAERYQHTETERRIRAALGTMPGGACEALNAPARGVGFNADRNPCRITLESVAISVLGALEGLTVVLRLPTPRTLGRGALHGDHAAFVPVFAAVADAPDAGARAKQIVGWALEDLGRALGRDIVGAQLAVEIGPETSWEAVRTRPVAPPRAAGVDR